MKHGTIGYDVLDTLYHRAIHTQSDQFKVLDKTLWTLCDKKEILKREQVCKLVEWKLKRGTFRPSLLSLVKANSEDKIDAVLKQAREKIEQMRESEPSSKDLAVIRTIIKILVELRGIGPATASLIAMTMSPNIPFFSDEAYKELTGEEKIKYTLKEYMEYVEKVYKLLEELKVVDERWSARLIEKMIWTQCALIRMGLDVEKEVEKLEGKKIKDDYEYVNVKELDDIKVVVNDDIEPVAKRQKK